MNYIFIDCFVSCWHGLQIRASKVANPRQQIASFLAGEGVVPCTYDLSY